VGSAQRLSRMLSGIPTVQLPVGTFVSASTDGTVMIDFGKGSVSCLSAGWFQPLPGDPVRCLRTDDGTVMIGPSMPRSSIGTVTATGSPYLTVLTTVGSRQLPYLSSYSSPAVNDSVDIDWASGGIVLGKTTAVPASTYTPPAPAASDFQADFRANDSGTFYVPGGNWAHEDVWCTSTGNNRGAWFYGNKIKDTIPDGAEIQSVRLYLDEYYNDFPAQLALIGMHSLGSKAGTPTIVSAVTVSAGSGWKTLPDSFGDALKTGARLGVGTGSSGASGFHKFRSRAADADSGLLRIKWRI
jgi:hypothetical protein